MRPSVLFAPRFIKEGAEVTRGIVESQTDFNPPSPSPWASSLSSALQFPQMRGDTNNSCLTELRGLVTLGNHPVW